MKGSSTGISQQTRRREMGRVSRRVKVIDFGIAKAMDTSEVPVLAFWMEGQLTGRRST